MTAAATPAASADDVLAYTRGAAVAAPLLGAGVAWRVEDSGGLPQMGLGYGIGMGVNGGLRLGLAQDGERFPALGTASTVGASTAMHQRYGFDVAWPFHAIAGTVALAENNRNDTSFNAVFVAAAVSAGSSWLAVERFPMSVTYAQLQEGAGGGETVPGLRLQVALPPGR